MEFQVSKFHLWGTISVDCTTSVSITSVGIYVTTPGLIIDVLIVSEGAFELYS